MTEPTEGEIRDAIEAMPQGLNDAFEETLNRIQRQADGRKKLGMNTLMWIYHAKRPLLISELSDALAIRPGVTSLNPLYRPSQKLIVDSCLGLVKVDEKSSTIRLIHYSVQEFLQHSEEKIFPMGDVLIAELTITYSLLDEFAAGSCPDEGAIEALISQNPFAAYAACFWGHHVRDAKCGTTEELALHFLRAVPQRICSYQISRYVAGYRELYWEPEEADSCNALMLTASFGLESLASRILEDTEDLVDAATKTGTTPLIKAAASGNVSLMKVLMNRGADPLKENWYGSAFHCAAEAGQVAALQELLQHGIEVDIRDHIGRTALHCATDNGHIAAMRTLLARGANINAKFTQGEQGYTALRYAVVMEQPPDVVKALLVSGAKTEIRDQHGVTPLHDAAALSLEDIMLLLLDFGANIHARTVHGNTALHVAAVRNHVDIVHILLDHGAEKDARTLDGVTSLFMAAERGGEETVRALLDSGADVEAEDDEGTTALHVAMRENHRNIVQLLLEAGASTNLSSRDGGTSNESIRGNGKDENGVQNHTKRKAFEHVGDSQEDASVTLMTYRFKSRDSMTRSQQMCTECDKSFDRPCDLTYEHTLSPQRFVLQSHSDLNFFLLGNTRKPIPGPGNAARPRANITRTAGPLKRKEIGISTTNTALSRTNSAASTRTAPTRANARVI